MQAAVLRKIGAPLAIEELPVPEPKRGEVLIKIAPRRLPAIFMLSTATDAASQSAAYSRP
jgi:hypothetical protein